MSGPGHSEAHSFNERFPRPPVPGEETTKFCDVHHPQSPALTPRRSSFVRPSQSSNVYDASAPLGFEPEGSCGKTTMENKILPACLQWAKSLHNLLHDPEGLELFRKYLDQEGRPHVNPLNFWFACEGLKKQRDPKQIHELIKLIHGRFLVKSQLQISEEVRKEANRRVKEGLVDKQIFRAAQSEVEHLINETTYPNFLRSETYIQYVQSCQNFHPGSCPSPGSSREISIACGSAFLPTLYEESEFMNSVNLIPMNSMPRELPLTKMGLLYSQHDRALENKRKPEVYAGIYLQPGISPYHVNRMHAQYSSYNPVSRQDSELQSVSSDARTESDTMSLNGSSIDGMSTGRPISSRKQHQRNQKAIKESAKANRDDNLDSIIPRTQRLDRDVNQPKNPRIFAEELINKLEILKTRQENGEKLVRHLQDLEFGNVSNSNLSLACPNQEISLTQLRRDLFIDEDSNDQAILDEHVSRIWSDLTPSRSPGRISPSPRSPERRRQLHSYSKSSRPKRDRDVFSTFSVDSGNIHDFPEGNELVGAGSMSSLGSHMPKSKSVPSDFVDTLHRQDFYSQGRDAQRLKKAEGAKKSLTKKSMTELTDSGVSVLSEESSLPRDRRLLSWLHKTEKGTDGRFIRQPFNLYGSRSGSLERGNQDMLAPAQPFVADPGMPPLPSPHTDIQLEEAKRRLLEDDRARGGNRQKYPSNKQINEPSRQKPSCSQSNQSTLRKAKHDEKDFTTVVFNIYDDSVPYRIKIPGHNITLKQLKEVLPKKGNYRYFFKTNCEDLDLDAKVILEEVTEDADILPLFCGKIMAELKACD